MNLSRSVCVGLGVPRDSTWGTGDSAWYARLYLARWRGNAWPRRPSPRRRAWKAARRVKIGRRRLRRRRRRTRWRLASARARRGISPFLCRCAEAGILAKGDDWHGLSNGPAARTERQELPAGCVRIDEALRGVPPAAQGAPFELIVTPRSKKRKGVPRGQRALATRGQVPAPQRAKPVAASDRDQAAPRRRPRGGSSGGKARLLPE